MTVAAITADLRAEHDALDAVVAPLDGERWSTPTPSPGWTVADQIAHLTYFDGTAVTAITDPERFERETAQLLEQVTSGTDMDEATLGWRHGQSPAELLARWRRTRSLLIEAAGILTDDDRVAWYGPSMGARSFLTARLMEVWAHGQDVVDAVGGHRPATDRLRHIAQLGVITRKWSYVNRGLEAPPGSVRVELAAPSGATWTWNEDATDGSVTGPAEDFCLVVTQRRHVDDTALETTPGLARDWMERAQAFAGTPTEGPPPRS